MCDMRPNILDSPGHEPSNRDHGSNFIGGTDCGEPSSDGDGALAGFVGQGIPQLVPWTRA